jgi:negative regulator of genetic competence, sporulation and motility
MELIVINENKLKIMMSPHDMKTYGLDENEFYCSVANTREILDRILHNSPVHTGFENISPLDKILMQLYPDKKGGCELYVTKLPLDEKEDEFLMSNEYEERYLLPKSTAKKQSQGVPIISYRFTSLEHAINAANEMNRHNYEGASSFYRDIEGKYFLFVNFLKSNTPNGISEMGFLSEFGEQVNAENSRMLLLERGQCIFKDKAIEQLSKL